MKSDTGFRYIVLYENQEKSFLVWHDRWLLLLLGYGYVL